MKTVLALVLLMFVGFHLTAPLAGQVRFFRQPTIQEALKRWADPETVEQWSQAMRAGWQGLWQGRPDEAATSFRRAVMVCEQSAAGRIQQCIPRLLLAEILLDTGNLKEATKQVDRLTSDLKNATRVFDGGKIVTPETVFIELVENLYRFQVGAALYVRAARIYLRLGRPERAGPLFREAAKIFEQRTLKREDLSFLLGRASREFPNYRARNHRTAEVDEAECRFLLTQGQDDQALQSLQQAEEARKAAAEGQSAELFVDQLVVEPLDKSFLSRFLDDCAFYRFNDQRIAGLLDRQAVLLRKAGRGGEATAFEKFGASLRSKPLTQ